MTPERAYADNFVRKITSGRILPVYAGKNVVFFAKASIKEVADAWGNLVRARGVSSFRPPGRLRFSFSFLYRLVVEPRDRFAIDTPEQVKSSYVAAIRHTVAICPREPALQVCAAFPAALPCLAFRAPGESRAVIGRSRPAGRRAAQPTFEVHLLNTFAYTGSTTPDGLSPNQIRGAYGLGTYTSAALTGGISFGGINGDGRGQTIAIVDAYDDPNAASDLNAFSNNYGLPTFGGTGNPTFTKLNENGGTTLPGTDPNGPSGSPVRHLGNGRIAGHRMGPRHGPHGQHHSLRSGRDSTTTCTARCRRPQTRRAWLPSR